MYKMEINLYGRAVSDKIKALYNRVFFMFLRCVTYLCNGFLKDTIMNECATCGTEIYGNDRYCSNYCETIIELRSIATIRLLYEEQTSFDDGYDTDIKRRWIAKKLNDISTGIDDGLLYTLYVFEQMTS